MEPNDTQSPLGLKCYRKEEWHSNRRCAFDTREEGGSISGCREWVHYTLRVAGRKQKEYRRRDHVNVLSGLHCFAQDLIEEKHEAIEARMQFFG